MDDFFQEFKPEDSFITLDDIAKKVVDERDALLEQEFLIQWRIEQQSKSPNYYIAINPQWQKHEFVALEKNEDSGLWFAKICTPLFEFPLDEYGVSVQNVMPFGSSCSQFVRMAQNEEWQLCLMPTVSTIFYTVENCQVILHNFDGYCTSKLDIQIVPSQSALPYNQQTIPDGKAAQIREAVLSKMFRDYAAKRGQIKMHNDGNPNVQNETGLIYDNLKTK